MPKSYGTIWLDKQTWHVQAEPHVMLLLKRIFPKINKGQHGTITLKHSPENCRDIEWLLQRHNLDVKASSRKPLAAGARQHRDHLLTLEQMIDPNYTPRAFELAVPLRNYQRLPAEMLLHQNFLLLGDDLGLGKTAEGIAPMTDPRALPAVVVAYPHLQTQWAKEIEKFAPSLQVHIVTKSKPYELPKFMGRGPDVVILTYHKLAGWAQTLASYAEYVVFDEVQELRHAGSDKYTAAEHLASACSYRMGMSATPVYNYGGEVFSILNVLSPGCLGDFEEFKREWCRSGSDRRVSIDEPKAFGTYLRDHGFMLRRTRADVGRELPPVQRIPHEIDADTDALDQIEDTAAELARIILRGHEEHKGQRMQAAEQLSNVVRQATGIAKAPHVADFVKLLVSAGEKVVLCGWHRSVYDIWDSKFSDLRVAWYTGSETPKHKDDAKEQFLAGDADVLILSLRSGAGLDGLQQVCRTIVFGELDWSPAVHEQAIGRLNRDGQADPVTAYYLVSESGADPVMIDVLGVKREQLEGVRNPEGDPIEELQTDGGHVKRLAEMYVAKAKQPAQLAKAG